MIKVKVADIVFLSISSFVDVGIGARHYYGKLEHLQGGNSIEVTYPLTRKEASAFNKEWRTISGLGYQVGEPTERFPSKKKLITAAKRQFKKHWPKATVLVLGSTAVVEPQEILVGPKEFKDKINVLAARYDELDWDNTEFNDRKEIKELELKWQKLWPRKYF